jgi:hypothetical protein
MEAMRPANRKRHRLHLSIDDTGRGQLLMDGVNLSQIVKRVTIEVQAGQGLTVTLALGAHIEATVDGIGELFVNHRRQ